MTTNNALITLNNRANELEPVLRVTVSLVINDKRLSLATAVDAKRRITGT